MARLRERENQLLRSSKGSTGHATKGTQKHEVRAGRAGVSSMTYARMSKNARSFLLQMDANPHIKAVMRDLADK